MRRRLDPIELLVVATILLLMGAVLFPVIAGAREATRQVERGGPLTSAHATYQVHSAGPGTEVSAQALDEPGTGG